MCDYDKDCNSWESCLTTSTNVIAWLDGDIVREYENIEVGTEFTERLKTGLQDMVDADEMVRGIKGIAKIEVFNHFRVWQA